MKKALLSGIATTFLLQLNAQIPDQRFVKLSTTNVYGLVVKETPARKILLIAREAFSNNYISLCNWDGTSVWSLIENDFISDLTDGDFGENTSGNIYFLDEEVGANPKLNLHTVDAMGNPLLNVDYDIPVSFYHAQIMDYQNDFLINYMYYNHNSLFKVDASGNVLWTYSVPRDTVNQTYWSESAMHVLTNGYTVIATTSGSAMLVSCVSSTGVQLWSKLYSNTFSFRDITISSNNLNEILIASENNDLLYITKLDISGFALFNKCYALNSGSSFKELIPGSISTTSDDKIFITGRYGELIGSDSVHRPFVSIFDLNGDYIKAISLTETGSAIHTKMANDSIIICAWDANYYVTDTTLALTCLAQPLSLAPATVVPFTSQNSASFPDPVITTSTGVAYATAPAFIHDPYCETLSNNDLSESPISITVFPNPANAGSEITIEGILNVKEIYLSDATGKLIRKFNPEKNNPAMIKLPEIEIGIYFLHIISDKNISVEKIMIY